MPTISELIEERRRFLNLSYREMQERAARAGLHVKYQTIAQLAKTAPSEWPKKTETIRGLAEAIDVPEQLVVLAFARSFGLDVRGGRSRLESLIPSGAKSLPSDVQDSIARLVRALVESSEEQANGTATNRAGGAGHPDIVLHDPAGQIVILIEAKAAEDPVGTTALEQYVESMLAAQGGGWVDWAGERLGVDELAQRRARRQAEQTAPPPPRLGTSAAHAPGKPSEGQAIREDQDRKGES